MIGALGEAGRGHLAMLCFSALIAGSFSLGKLAVPYIEPSVLNATRFAIACGIAAALASARGQLSRKTFEAPWRYLILGGIYAVYFMTMFEALKTVAAVSTSAIFTLTPLLAALTGRIWLKERMSPRMTTALLIGAAGALWVIFRADLGALMRFEVGHGEMIFVGGCLAHAVYPTVTRSLNRGEAPLATNTGMLAAVTMLLALYGWSDLRLTEWSALPPIAWITIFYTSVFSGVTTFSLIQYASLRLPAGKVMAYTYLVPSWVVIWQIALGQEAPPLRVVFGVVLIVAALLMLLKDES